MAKRNSTELNLVGVIVHIIVIVQVNLIVIDQLNLVTFLWYKMLVPLWMLALYILISALMPNGEEDGEEEIVSFTMKELEEVEKQLDANLKIEDAEELKKGEDDDG